MQFDILKHSNVPKHEILSDDEIVDIFSDVEYEIKQLPKIKVTDPVVKAIDAKEGDILRITRTNSQTAGTFITYRLVE
ncbi:MAG: DNA-directed RNA polymerase subunit H [archaeon]|nr:DNA-directed RNA polymerase subunit H [archaeon]